MKVYFSPPLWWVLGETDLFLEAALLTTLGAQNCNRRGPAGSVFAEAEWILNSEPLGYGSSDMADVDQSKLSADGAARCFLRLFKPRSWVNKDGVTDRNWLNTTGSILLNITFRACRPDKSGEQKNPGVLAGKAVKIVDPQLPRPLWPVGLITETFPGSDGWGQSRSEWARIYPPSDTIHSSSSCMTSSQPICYLHGDEHDLHSGQ